MEPNMNKRTDAKDPAEGLHSLDIDALVEARHPDPFSKLGLHQTESGHVVRVLLPGASGVTVIDRESGAALGSLTKIHDAGLYAGFVDRPGAYRLTIDWHGTPQDTHDTYAFSPVLSDEWLNRLAGADPYAVLECLGSRPVTHEGIAGVRFAVWAPNARRVSVVGDFNSWDGRRHPMRLRHNAGVWELFVPGLGAGTRYKYEIVSRDGHTLPLKADPCAMQSEKPPATASVVADADAIDSFAWTDGDWMQYPRREADGAGADHDLRSPRRIVAARARGRQSRDELARTRRAPDSVREGDGLHAPRIHADRGASVRRLVGLPAARAVCAVGAFWHAGAVRASS